MKKNSVLVLLLAFCIGHVSSGFSEIRLPAVLGSHMVLQQKSEVNLWGWSNPGEKIRVMVDWDTTIYHATGLRT
ncbi:hypothetical protein HUU40_14400, partial [candidate division KSB1 bacterium]|nr:hypothetical protein [candidate division KSB1 bacterium]